MPETRKMANRIDLLILLLTLFLMLFSASNYGLYEPHESHFAMVGREMVLRGDWITPYLNGAPYLNKPPLLYWFIAISTTILGNTEFAARFPLVLAGWLGIIIAGKWSQELWGIEARRTAILMLSVSLGWFIFTHQILIDVLLGTLLLLGNYFLWKLVHNSKSWIYFIGFYSCVALSFLTKGFLGVVFLGCSYIALFIANYPHNFLQKTRLITGLLLVLVLILPWCIAIEKANPGFWHYFIFNEHLERILDRRFPADYEVSKISSLGYLGITAVWCLPWTIFFPVTINFAWKQWRNKTNLNSLNDAILLLAIAFFLPILFFLPLSSRLIYYSLPCLPPYIIFCAGFLSINGNNKRLLSSKVFRTKTNLLNQNYVRVWNNLRQNLNTNNVYGLLLIITGIIWGFLIILIPEFTNFFPGVEQETTIISLVLGVLIALSLGWLIAGIEILRNNYQLSVKALVISFVFTYMVIIIGFQFYQYIRSSKQFVEISENHLRIDTLWIFEGSREIGAAAGISYYLNQEKEFTKEEIFVKNIKQLPVGWVSGKDNIVYRNILVLEDGGNNRLPPQFPGEKPNYLINKQQLQTYWNSDRSVVFVTDFLRNGNDKNDSLSNNLPQGTKKSWFRIGQKQIYGNKIAQRVMSNE